MLNITSVNGKSPKPNEWATMELWRNVHMGDTYQARRARQYLKLARLYPTTEVDPHDGAVQIANQKAAMQKIIDELNPTDLFAIYQAARLLVVVPREEEV